MSLINDALKRAKESQGQNPPPPAPPEKTGFRPVEPAPAKGKPVLLWLIIVILLVGLGAFFIGQSTHKETTSKIDSTVANEAPTQPAKVVEAQSTPVVATKALPVAAAVSPAPAPPNPAAAVAVVATPPVAPVPLKLQSIIFDPRAPSAMVNGKTLFVGQRINGFLLVKILRNSVMLTGGGQTNILELEE
jgi:hypothetical protein